MEMRARERRTKLGESSSVVVASIACRIRVCRVNPFANPSLNDFAESLHDCRSGFRFSFAIGNGMSFLGLHYCSRSAQALYVAHFERARNRAPFFTRS